MKIIELRAQNVKRLSAVEIRPDGSLVIVGGNNGAGKSSVLDSIMYALAGAGSIPSKPVRRGAKKATVELDLGELKVRRTMTADGGGALAVTAADGSPVRSPQAMLDALCSKIAFDPLEFSRMASAKQAETLRCLVGLDTTEMDRERAQAYQERTEAGRNLRAAEARVAAMPPRDNQVPDTEVSVADLAATLERMRDAVAGRERAESRVERVMADCEARRATVADLEARLAKAKADMVSAGKLLDEARAALEALPPSPNIEAHRRKLADAENVNRGVRANAARAEAEGVAYQARVRVTKLTTRLDELDEQKRAALAAAKMPVEGLGIDDAGVVVLGGLPLEVASSAEVLRVSVAMGLAANPKLKVLLIRDGSLLDERSLAQIAKLAEEADAQLWIERVGHGAECSVVIEDGAVREEEP